ALRVSHVRTVHPALDGPRVPDELPEEPAQRTVRGRARGRPLRGLPGPAVRLGRGLEGLAAPPGLPRPHGAPEPAGRLEAPGDLVSAHPRDRARSRRPGRLASGDSVSPKAAAAPPRSGLEAALRAGRFAVTAEMQPVNGADPDQVRRLASGLKGRVDAANCTDNAAARPHLSPLATGRFVVEAGVQPVVPLTCPARNPPGPPARPPRAPPPPAPTPLRPPPPPP